MPISSVVQALIVFAAFGTGVAANWALADEPGRTEGIIPATRAELAAALEAATQRKPRLAMPAPSADEPMLGYLPASWGGGGGLGGPGQVNPRTVPDRSGRHANPLEDTLFTDASFWVVSRANDCHYCLGRQEWKLRVGGLNDEQMAALDHDWTAFDPRQRTALTFARQLTLEPASIGDAQIAQLKQHFTDVEIIEIAFAVARFNAVNRWTTALGLPLETAGERDGHTTQATTLGSGDLTPASIVTPPMRSTPAETPAADEIAAALEATRQRTARVELPTEAAARAALAGVVRDRAPNAWERALAGLPIVGRTHVLVWTTILEDQHLAPRFKAELAYVTAINNRAWYAAGTAMGRLEQLGATDAELAAIARDSLSDADGPSAAYRLARKLTLEPQRIGDADVAAVQRHFTDSETAQIIQVICLANLFDRFTEALGLPLDP